MPHPGPKRGAQPRTLRDRALQVGSSPGGFPPDEPYNPTAGTPEELAGGKYESNVTEGGATPASPATDAKNPFKLGPA